MWLSSIPRTVQVHTYLLKLKNLEHHKSHTAITGIPWLVLFLWSPGNRTIWKTALIEHWFSTKIAILDFWIFKVPFFAYFNDFNQQKTTLLDHLQFIFNVTVLRIINQLDSWKIIVNYLCTDAEKKDTIRKSWKKWNIFEKKIAEKIEIV